MNAPVFKRIWLPGFLFQSVVIGGGYATGRELVEFFLSLGPKTGLVAMFVSAACFSIVAAFSFEFARITLSYNYRPFFRKLLGPAWILYEIAYVVLGLLVLAVVGSAAGELFAVNLGGSTFTGTVILMALIGVLVFKGTAVIEKVLAGWSFLLYATYALLVGLFLWRSGDVMMANFSADSINSRWFSGGIKYAGYNLAALPLILFCVRHMESRRDTISAGLLTGLLAMLPAILFYLAMVASDSGLLESSVPADYLIQALAMPSLKVIFYIVLFGTFVETGAAFIHGANERLEHACTEKNKVLADWARPLIGIVALSISVILAETIGLIGLIANGYTALTWVFILVFVIPLLTLGTWKIFIRSA